MPLHLHADPGRKAAGLICIAPFLTSYQNIWVELVLKCSFKAAADVWAAHTLTLWSVFILYMTSFYRHSKLQLLAYFKQQFFGEISFPLSCCCLFTADVSTCKSLSFKFSLAAAVMPSSLVSIQNDELMISFLYQHLTGVIISSMEASSLAIKTQNTPPEHLRASLITVSHFNQPGEAAAVFSVFSALMSKQISN